MKVLVTGGAGFIGSHLVDSLVARSHEVIVLDNLDPQVHGPAAREPRHLKLHIDSSAIRFLHGDVTDPAALDQALNGVDAVVHLAAAVGVGQSMYEPHYYVHTNATGSGLLLDRLVKLDLKVSRLVVASSMSLYGEGACRCTACGATNGSERDETQLASGQWEVVCAMCGDSMEPQPTLESKAPAIASVYAATKKHQEDLFVAWGRAYRIPTLALRFFNVYGPRQSLSNPYTGVAAIFLSRLLNGNPPMLFEDGGQLRDFVDVRDISRALVLAVESESVGTHVLNIGTGRRTSVAKLASGLATSLGVEVSPVLMGRYRAGDVRHCYADAKLAHEVLGFRAEYSVEQGLPRLIEWCRGEQATDQVEHGLNELRSKGLVV